jgi:hypothetical protein
MKRVNVIELMGRRGFPATESLYGQNILKTDLLRYLTNDSGVMWHFLGSNISDSISRDNVTVVNIPTSAWGAHGAYCNYVKNLCENTSDPVILVSSFAHEEQDQLIDVFKLKRLYSNLKTVVVLHCPKPELVRNKNEVNDFLEFGSGTWQNQSTSGWIRLLKKGVSDKLVDKWVAVSSVVAESFSLDLNQSNGSNVTTIVNGVDEIRHHILEASEKETIKRQLGLDDLPIVGTTSGYKQAKGDLIMRNILSYYASNTDSSPQFLFPMLPGYSSDRLLREILKKDIRDLLINKKLFLFFDASAWTGVVPFNDLETHYMHEANKQFAKFSPEEGALLRRVWLGILDFPVQQIMDIYIRPSLSEAFGRGSVEAGLCGSVVIPSDRGYMHKYSLHDNVVHLPRSLVLKHKDEPVDESFIDAAQNASDRFIKIIDINLKKILDGELDPVLNRSLCLDTCPSINVMVQEWSSLFKELSIHEDIL